MICRFSEFDLKIRSPMIMTIGNKVAKSNPILRLPPTASAIFPVTAGLIVAPKSPANAKKANNAVPPFGHFCVEMLIVPGHIIPTANPHNAQPASPIIEMRDSEAVK